MSARLPILPKGGPAVMQRRLEPPDSLDYFPTPPWATRAFLQLLDLEYPGLRAMSAWEPACGELHMAAVLAELFPRVETSDVFDYGAGARVYDFLSAEPAPFACIDWIITNPPFKVAAEFVERGLSLARAGVAVLVRTSWLEGGDRYDRLFSRRPPALIVQYAERVPMTKGRWDPEASTATSYCWVVWDHHDPHTKFRWIPPGQRRALTTPQDLARFAVRAETPLFGDAGG